MKNLKPYLKCFSAALTVSMFSLTAGAFNTSYYTQTSKLSSGKWVKIKVTDEGIHQISYADLISWGFSDPSAVRVYGYGGCALTEDTYNGNMVDDLPAMPVVHTDDQRLLFYGEGDVRLYANSATDMSIKRNYYATAGYYLLSDAQISDDLSEAEVNSALSSSVYSSHISTTLNEDEVQNPVGFGALFHGNKFSPGDVIHNVFHIEDFSPTSSWKNGMVYYKFAAKCSQTISNMTIKCPDGLTKVSSVAPSCLWVLQSSIAYKTGYGFVQFNAGDADAIEDGDYDFYVTTQSSPTPSYAATDYAWISYPRANKLGDRSQLVMQFPGVGTSDNFILSDVPENVKVFNISNTSNVYAHKLNYNTGTATAVGSFDKSYTSITSGTCRLIAFNPDATDFSGVQYVSEVENQNIHGDMTPTMLIVTNSQFYDRAVELAEAHRQYDGIDVNVYTQDQIFNEFSSGTPSTMGIRRLVKMYYDRGASTFKYVLLYGPGTWDNRHITTTDKDQILTHEAQIEDYAANLYTAYAHDNYFGLVDDDYSPSNIMLAQARVAVGRVPVTDDTEAAELNRKCIKHMSTIPLATKYPTAIFLSDDGNANIHLTQSEAAISEMKTLRPELNFVRAHNLVFPWVKSEASVARQVIIDALTAGAGYFCYTGHGNSTAFTAEKLWTSSAVKTTNYDTQPLAMLATCDSYLFDTEDDYIAKDMVLKETGGMIGVVGAGRTVYLEYNQILNLAMARQYASATEDTTIGDIYVNARNAAVNVASDKSYAVNTLDFNFCGDPALKVYAPARSINLVTVDGQEMPTDDDALITIDPVKKVAVTGTVNNSDGSVDTSFNGDIQIKFFENANTVTTVIKNSSDSSDGTVDVTLDQDVLSTTVAHVTNGQFSTDVVNPYPLRTGDVNRVMLTAVTDDGETTALGCSYKVSVSSEIQDVADAQGPEITEFYLDDTSFEDGATVAGEFRVIASILVHDLGLNTSSAIGASAKLILDGSTSYNSASNAITIDADGTASLNYIISEIADGQHTLTLTVADNAGNSTSRSLSFIVINQNVSVEVLTDAKAARDKAVIDYSHTFGETPSTRLVIVDKDQNTVFTGQDLSFPYTWNLKDMYGSDVPDGYYDAYVIANASGNYATSPAAKITVIR